MKYSCASDRSTLLARSEKRCACFFRNDLRSGSKQHRSPETGWGSRCSLSLGLRAGCITSSFMQGVASWFRVNSGWRHLKQPELPPLWCYLRSLAGSSMPFEALQQCLSKRVAPVCLTGSNEDPWCRRMPRWACVLSPKEPAWFQVQSILADCLYVTTVDTHCYCGHAKANCCCLSTVIAQRSLL